MFIGDVTAERSGRINSEVYRATQEFLKAGTGFSAGQSSDLNSADYVFSLVKTKLNA